MLKLNVNGQTHRVDVLPDTPLLWVLRDAIGLTGTKYGCGCAAGPESEALRCRRRFPGDLK
jgi:aerobic-type carbon monoxide dehydrogenase small subunit (CoxS/CutS family)